MPADNASIEQEHRDVESMAALQHGVAVDIDNIDGREWGRTPKSAQLGQHLVAQLTVVTMDDCQTESVGGHVKAVLLVMRAGLYGVAMKRTVAGGTSPTAVTL